MKISDRGLAFIARHEGFVSRAYRDPVGIVTIGTGFTNGSRVAVRMLGKIRMGMVITREQNDRVLRSTLEEEYGPAVDAALPGAPQHGKDSGDSYSFNCGPGAMKDKWTGLWRAGDVAAAARRLRSSRITAKKKRLRGLEHRRKAESLLLEFGDYGDGKGKSLPGRDPARSLQEPRPLRADEDLKAWQEKLEQLGYDVGEPDGWHGPRTTRAITAFQASHPHLKADGILGPATIAAIERALAARKAAAGAVVLVPAGGTGAATAIVNSGTTWGLWQWGGIAIGTGLVLAGGVLAWRYRDEIRQRLFPRARKN